MLPVFLNSKKKDKLDLLMYLNMEYVTWKPESTQYWIDARERERK